MKEFEKKLVAELETLQRYARYLTRMQKGEQDDLVQNTLLRALDKQHLFQDGTSMKAWLLTVMHNVNVNRVRISARYLARHVDDDMTNIPVPASQEKTVELKECARELTKLSVDAQQVIKLIALENFDYEQAAKILSVPTGTVRSRLSRGRDELRERTGRGLKERRYALA